MCTTDSSAKPSHTLSPISSEVSLSCHSLKLTGASKDKDSLQLDYLPIGVYKSSLMKSRRNICRVRTFIQPYLTSFLQEFCEFFIKILRLRIVAWSLIFCGSPNSWSHECMFTSNSRYNLGSIPEAPAWVSSNFLLQISRSAWASCSSSFFFAVLLHNVFLNLSLSQSSTLPSSAMLSDILNISFSLFALSLQLLTKCFSFLSRPYPVPPHCGKSLSTFLGISSFSTDPLNFVESPDLDFQSSDWPLRFL